jgi:hypothetical protein
MDAPVETAADAERHTRRAIRLRKSNPGEAKSALFSAVKASGVDWRIGWWNMTDAIWTESMRRDGNR